MITTKNELIKLRELELKAKNDLKLKKNIYEACSDKYVCDHAGKPEGVEYRKARNLVWKYSQAIPAALFEVKTGKRACDGVGSSYLQEVKKNI